MGKLPLKYIVEFFNFGVLEHYVRKVSLLGTLKIFTRTTPLPRDMV